MAVKHKISFIITVLLFIGCGVMGQPDPQPKEKMSVPKKFTVEIPEVLRSIKDDQAVEQKILVEPKEENATSYKYVKDYVAKIEYVLMGMENNPIITSEILLKVYERCISTPKDEICTVPGGSFSFVLNQETVDLIKAVTPIQFSGMYLLNYAVGHHFQVGDVEFIHYSQNPNYAYGFNIEIFNLEIYSGLPKVFLQIKWSQDENRCFTGLSFDYGNGLVSPWGVHYNNAFGIKESMRIYEALDSLKMGDENNPYMTGKVFSLTNWYDDNETSSVKFNSIDSTTYWKRQLSSNIKLTKFNGLQKLLFAEHNASGSIKSNHEEVFDGEGRLLAATYCSTLSEECTLYDNTTWYTDHDNVSIFDLLKTLEFEDLKIEGELKNGDYLLLPPNYTLDSNQTIQEILDHRVGDFVVLDEVRQGVLLNNDYRDKLNELQVLYSKYNTQLDLYSVDAFDMLSDEERPTITLWSSE